MRFARTSVRNSGESAEIITNYSTIPVLLQTDMTTPREATEMTTRQRRVCVCVVVGTGERGGRSILAYFEPSCFATSEVENLNLGRGRQ